MRISRGCVGAALAVALMACAPARAGEVGIHVGVGGGYGHCGPYYGRHHHHHGWGPRYYGGSAIIVSPPPLVIERPERVVVLDRAAADRELIRAVQAELQRRFFYNGAVDGIFGPQTRDAIRSYQMRRGLPVTGDIDPPLLDALRIR